MTDPKTLTRRRFLGTAAAGSLAVAGLGALAPRALSGASPRALGERLVPPGKLALQQFSLRTRGRAAGSRRATPPAPRRRWATSGGRAPDDPTDLGPLVPLPGGFAEVFEYLASVGYKGFEFFSFSQTQGGTTNPPITTQEIRTALDNAGLQSVGSHTGSIANLFNPRPRRSSSRSRRSSVTPCSAPPATRAAATRCRTALRTRTRSGGRRLPTARTRSSPSSPRSG